MIENMILEIIIPKANGVDKVKYKIIYIAAVALLLSGCSAAGSENEARGLEYGRLGVEQPSSANGIQILTEKSSVRPGEYGLIVMLGQPGVTYRITATYKVDGRELTATELNAAGPDGYLTWTWYVAPKTTPGTYPIQISGGGKVFKTSYTVIE